MQHKGRKHIYFECPTCGKHAWHVTQIKDEEGNKIYICENCQGRAVVRNIILASLVYGILIGILVSLALVWLYPRYLTDYTPFFVFLIAAPFVYVIGRIIYPLITKVFLRWERAE